MKPYPEATGDPGEITFKKELSSAWVAIEYAFGRLKSRWRILQKQNNIFGEDRNCVCRAT